MAQFIEFVDRRGRRFAVPTQSICLLREVEGQTRITFTLGPRIVRCTISDPFDTTANRLKVNRVPMRSSPAPPTPCAPPMLPTPSTPQEPAEVSAPIESPETFPSGRRRRRVLHLLLMGKSEKEIAAELGISIHTVHVYVKQLHEHYNVVSRGELLARFVRTDVLTALSKPFVHAAQRFMSAFSGGRQISENDRAEAKRLIDEESRG